MERQFGDSTWDIYANHKGEWCLYESHTCQEGRCVDCEIHQQIQKKWRSKQMAELDRIFSQNAKLNQGGRNLWYLVVLLIGAFLGYYAGNKEFRAKFNKGVSGLFKKAVDSIDSANKKPVVKDDKKPEDKGGTK